MCTKETSDGIWWGQMRRTILSRSIRNGGSCTHLDSPQQLAERMMKKLRADVLLKQRLLIEEAVTLSGPSAPVFRSAQTQLYQINGLFSAARFCCHPSSALSAVRCCFLRRGRGRKRFSLLFFLLWLGVPGWLR